MKRQHILAMVLTCLAAGSALSTPCAAQRGLKLLPADSLGPRPPICTCWSHIRVLRLDSGELAASTRPTVAKLLDSLSWKPGPFQQILRRASNGSGYLYVDDANHRISGIALPPLGAPDAKGQLEAYEPSRFASMDVIGAPGLRVPIVMRLYTSEYLAANARDTATFSRACVCPR